MNLKKSPGTGQTVAAYYHQRSPSDWNNRQFPKIEGSATLAACLSMSPLRHWRFFSVLVVFAFAIASVLPAVTLTNAYGGGSATITANFNVSTGKMDISWANTDGAEGSPDPGHWYGNTWITLVSGDGVTSGTDMYDRVASTSPGSVSLTVTPGQWICLVARCASTGVPSWWTVNGDKRTWIQAVDPTVYKARMPALSNTTAYAIHYRLVHDDDGVVATVIVPPGGSVPAADYTVSSDADYHIESQSPDAKAGEAGYAADGVWTQVTGTPADSDDWVPGDDIPPYPEHEPPTFPELPDIGTDPKTPQAQAERPSPGLWRSATAATTDAERLDKTTYKQGVDKLLTEMQIQTEIMKGPKSEVIAQLIAESQESVTSYIGLRATDMNNALPSTFEGAPTLPNTTPATGDAVFVANIPGEGPAKLLGANTLSFRLDVLAPNWKTLGGWMREASLILLGLSFMFFTQKKFEQYYLTFWMVSEKTTKAGGVTNVPLAGDAVGITKQLATALALTLALTTAIAIIIAALNTQLASLIAGTTITNAMAGIGGRVSTLMEALTVPYSFLNVFIPIPAAIQYMAAHYFLAWTMAPLWTLAYSTARFFHV